MILGPSSRRQCLHLRYLHNFITAANKGVRCWILSRGRGGGGCQHRPGTSLPCTVREKVSVSTRPGPMDDSKTNCETPCNQPAQQPMMDVEHTTQRHCSASFASIGAAVYIQPSGPGRWQARSGVPEKSRCSAQHVSCLA